LKHLAPDTDLLVILMNKSELADRLQTLGLKLVILDEQQNSSIRIFFGILKSIRQFKPDVIHTHRQKENILGGFANLLAIPFRGKLTPSVRTSHGAPEFNPKGKQKIQVWLDKWVGNYLQKKVIAVSEDLANKLTAIYPANHIVVIQNGVDTESLKQSVQIADWKQNYPDKTHIGIIGRLEPVKRIDIFLEMAALLLKEDSNNAWRFHIIGDGKLRASMESLAKNLGIQNDVIFHGHRNDIPSCIASLDAIVMCSDHEGTPMTALEAMALGTPLIAHAVGGLKELLLNHPSLVHEHTPVCYASAVRRQFDVNFPAVALDEKYYANRNAGSTIRLYQSLS
jgi:L-malate glycosyltransferase